METVAFFSAFLWGGWCCALIWLAAAWRNKNRRPYLLADYVANITLGDRGEELDSRRLRRAVSCLEAGARLANVDEDYWRRMNRRLKLMGFQEDSRHYLTGRLIRSAALALPSLLCPALMENLWLTLCYPAFTAVLFRRELKILEKRFQEWQRLLVREVPEVVDRLGICFAGGRDYLAALEEAADSTGQAMGRALKALAEDIRARGSRAALASFNSSFDLPATSRLASALSLAVESGYEAAEVYLVNIEEELRALRQDAADALAKGKPEKVKELYLILFGLSTGALLLKGWEILGQVGRLFA